MKQTSMAASALAASSGGPAVVADVPDTGAFSASGPDAGSFLHGQLAADITGLTVGQARRSLLLNHKGHALADAVVARGPDGWLVIVEDGMADWVGTTLAEHIIFDDLTLTRLGVPATLTLQGSGASAVLAAAVPAAHEAADQAEGSQGDGGRFWRGVHAASGLELVVYPRRRSVGGGFDLTLLQPPAPRSDFAAAAAQGAPSTEPVDTLAPLRAALVAAGATRVTAEAIDAARVAARLATAGRDGGPGVLPQEADLTNAISYRKGCYLGQEVMARIEARGNLRRGLATVEVLGAEPRPASGSEAVPGAVVIRDAPRIIELAGRSVGVLGTTALMPDGRVLALAVLRGDLEDGTVLTSGGSQLRVAHLPPL